MTLIRTSMCHFLSTYSVLMISALAMMMMMIEVMTTKMMVMMTLIS